MLASNTSFFMSEGPSTNLQLTNAACGIKNFQKVFMLDELPDKPWIRESAIVNLHTSKQPGSHWTCYRKIKNQVWYFDSFGSIPPPPEVLHYFRGCELFYNTLSYQTYDQQNCGQLCIRFLRGELKNTHHRLT